MTTVKNIYLNWDLRDSDQVINEGANTRTLWEAGVKDALKHLLVHPPCKTSLAVLNELQAIGKYVTIIPHTIPAYDTDLAGLPAKINAGAVAVNIPAATVRGKLSDELPNDVIQQIGQAPVGPERDRIRERYAGTAQGSDVTLFFTAQDWGESSRGAGLDAADETLLHELIHAVRQMLGQEEPDRLLAPFSVLQRGERGDIDSEGKPTRPNADSQVYDTLEEFAAIVITNIYRSEKGRQGLRRDHLATEDHKDSPLSAFLSNPRTFLTAWRPQLERMQRELPRICDWIAPIICPFNPLFELYVAQNRFLPGTRNVRPSVAH